MNNLQRSAVTADELKEILLMTEEDKVGNIFISGVVDQDKDLMVLVRSDYTTMKVPLSHYAKLVKKKKTAAQPNFDDFEITDHGRTIRFGEFEICADTIKDWDV